jgi:predicted DNA-binding ribbon-helix-helix protein
MCRMFAHQPVSNYESQTRSIRIQGHATSIRLENTFWNTLEDIAAQEGSTVGRFVNTLHDEVLNRHGEVRNLASLLRCSCMLYAAQSAGAPARSLPLIAAE